MSAILTQNKTLVRQAWPVPVALLWVIWKRSRIGICIIAAVLFGMALLANTVLHDALVGSVGHPFIFLRDFISKDARNPGPVISTVVVCLTAWLISMSSVAIFASGWSRTERIIFRSPASTNELAYWPLCFGMSSSAFVWIFVGWFVFRPMGLAVNIVAPVSMAALSTVFAVSCEWKKTGASRWWLALAYPVSMMLTPYCLFASIPLYAWFPLAALARLYLWSLPHDIGYARAGVEKPFLKDRPYPKWAQALNEGLISNVKAMTSPIEALAMLDFSSARDFLLVYSVVPACFIVAVPCVVAIKLQFAYLDGLGYDIRDSILTTCLFIAVGGSVCVASLSGSSNDIRYRYSRPVDTQEIVIARILTSLISLRQSLFCTSLVVVAGFILPCLISLYLGCPMKAWIWPTIVCFAAGFTTALFLNVRGCFTISPVQFTSSGLLGLGIFVLEGFAVAAVLYPFIEMSSACRIVFNVVFCIWSAVKLASFAWTVSRVKRLGLIDAHGFSLLRKIWIVGVPYFWIIYFLICPNYPMKLLMLLPLTVIALPIVRPVLALLVVNRERHT